MNDEEATMQAARLARLPAWARLEIARLNRDRDEWQRRATAGPDDSDTFIVGPALREKGDTPLGRRPRIRFDLPGGEVEARIVDGAVEVSADPRMLIAPRGNAVTITVVPR